MQTRISITVLISILAASALSVTYAECPDEAAGSWEGHLTPEDEPGEPMVVTGRLFQPDGKTPAAGTALYAYQTDKDGEYHRNEDDEARLCNAVTTDENGRWRFRTIRPGAYPGTNIPAHIHFVAIDDGEERATFLLEFGEEHEFDQEYRDRYGPDSDPAERRATARPIALDEEGVWHCSRDLVLPAK